MSQKPSMDVLQRGTWTGEAKELGELFHLTKGNGTAIRAVVFSHQEGWQVRLEVTGLGLLLSRVCRTEEEVFLTGEYWKAALLEQGWMVHG
jgi:hypothetical protein